MKKYTFENLDSIGNVEGNPINEWIISSYGHTKTKTLILKNYMISNINGPKIYGKDMFNTTELARNEIKEGNLKPFSGLGFSILSDGIFNVCRWDSKEVDVIVPQIYTSEKKVWAPQKVEDVGAFCSVEKLIYDHENKAWLKYLKSDRKKTDKQEYLSNLLFLTSHTS